MIVKPFFLLLLCVVLSTATSAEKDPQQVVKQTADAVLNEVLERKAELEADSSLIYPLIEKSMKSRLDLKRITRSAMGRFWRKASIAQQQRLVAEFEQLLIRTYAIALLSYSGQEIEYPATRFAEDAKQVTVPSRVKNVGAPAIPIDYRLYLTDEGNWLVYDVVIDNVSLVTTYRSSFMAEIRQGSAKAKAGESRMSVGIDHLIASLAAKNAQKKQP